MLVGFRYRALRKASSTIFSSFVRCTKGNGLRLPQLGCRRFFFLTPATITTRSYGHKTDPASYSINDKTVIRTSSPISFPRQGGRAVRCLKPNGGATSTILPPVSDIPGGHRSQERASPSRLSGSWPGAIELAYFCSIATKTVRRISNGSDELPGQSAPNDSSSIFRAPLFLR